MTFASGFFFSGASASKGGLCAATYVLLVGCNPTARGSQAEGLNLAPPICPGPPGGFGLQGATHEAPVDEGDGYVSQLLYAQSANYMDEPPVLRLEDCATGGLVEVSGATAQASLAPIREPVPYNDLMPRLRRLGQETSFDALMSLASDTGFASRRLTAAGEAASCGCTHFYPELASERL